MNPFEREKQKIMKKLHNRQIHNAKAFQSQNSQIEQVANEQFQNQSLDDLINSNHSSKHSYFDDGSEDRTEELKLKLIMIHQNNTLDKVFEFLNEKVFWLKFLGFKKISTQSFVSLDRSLIKQQVKQNLLSNLQKDTSQNELKRLAFSKFKLGVDKANQIRIQKTSFFAKYYIHAEYTKVCFAFLAIKSFAESKNSYTKVQKSENHVKFIESEEKLVKFQKQSRKFRAKSLFVTVRNFVNKKYVKSSFNQIKFSKNQNELQIHKQNPASINDSKSQSKDARFIKKKVLPHKIIQQNFSKKSVYETNLFHLDHISFGNYQVQTVKRKHIKIVESLHKFFTHKIMVYCSTLFSALSLFKSEKSHSKKIPQSSKQQDEDSDFLMIQNVMKSLCYLSSKTHSKRRSQKQKQKRKLALILMRKVIKKALIQNLSSAFYGLKSLELGEYLSLTMRIKELEELKRHYLEYFDNSLIQNEDNYE